MSSLRTSALGRKGRLIALLAGLLLLSCVANLALGAVPIPPGEVIAALLGRGSGTTASIVLYARLPRLWGCLLAGAALACSGVIIQGVLNNPLAAPNVIGVNSGAGLATALCCAVAPGAVRLTPLAAFLGALAGVLLVLFISERAGAARITLVLAGVAISSIFSAGIDAVVTFVPDALSGYTDFRIGGVKNLSMARLAPAFWVILIALVIALSLSNELDLLLLGRETAQSLGLPARPLRLALLMLAAALAGAAVSFAGLLGFVGLLVPHIMRRLIGENSLPLLLSSALGGGLLLTACDLASRLIFAPFELPLGVVLSLVGGPFFIWLLLRQRRGGGGL
ncbi:MAG: iron ABC transporter permease [Lawsonibacter sp.]|nr:iron ABC transporter permease [Lawsonibacter sp.]